MADKRSTTSAKNGQLGGRPIGAKSYTTIAREKAREIFELKQLEKWELISEAQANDALKDRQSREYTINQVIGKPRETIDMVVDASLKLDV